LLLSGALLFGGAARADDRWWGTDKAQHLALSAAMAGAWYATCSLLGDDPRPLRIVFAVALSLTPGVLKELHDSGQPGKAFSAEDLTWNLVGATAGSLLGLAVDLLLARRREKHSPWPLIWVERGAGLLLRF
jgi:uncharacterized protein YfiM (DUF2279 family)